MTESQTLTEADLFVTFAEDVRHELSETDFYLQNDILKKNVSEADLLITDEVEIFFADLEIEDGRFVL